MHAVTGRGVINMCFVSGILFFVLALDETLADTDGIV